MYVPLSGSFPDSALPIVPRSNHWTDEDVKPTFGYDEGKTVKGAVRFSVPEVAESTRPLDKHRPDVSPGGFMLFSPMLVHGGGSNGSHHTRFSFEFRLEPQ